MVEVYNVGLQQLEDYELKEIVNDKRFLWTVYWYESGSYEGDGEAVSLGKNGLLYKTSLGHCSCCGPTENWSGTHTEIQIDEFFRYKESIMDEDSRKEVKDKVAELLESGLSDKQLEVVVAGKDPLSIVSLGVSAASVANKIVQERKRERASSLFKNKGSHGN